MKTTERLQERLKQRDFKLKALLEITNAINDNLPTENLLNQFRDIVENQLTIRRLVLYTRIDDLWQCPIQYGVQRDYSHVEVEPVFRNYRQIHIVQSEEESIFKEFDLLIPVFRDERPLSYVLIGDMEDEAIKMSPIIKHMRFVQTLANIISVAIENKFLFSKSLEQERVNTELALAAEMQALMVGSGSRTYEGFEVATFYKPHQEVGGDFCDFIWFNPDEAFICMADVSGKGVSAAFLMANVQAHLRALLEHTKWTLEGIARQLNKKVNETVKGDRFITMFLGYFHKPTRTLHYINAGHNPPVVWDEGTTHLLDTGTVGIGMLPELPFVHAGSLKLGVHATLVCYTDGVVEIESPDDEEFGTDRLSQILIDHCPSMGHAEELIPLIMNAVDKHRQTVPYFDDTALLCCRFA